MPNRRKAMVTPLATVWDSSLPKEQDPTWALLRSFGRKLHCTTLEGWEAFDPETELRFLRATAPWVATVCQQFMLLGLWMQTGLPHDSKTCFGNEKVGIIYEDHKFETTHLGTQSRSSCGTSFVAESQPKFIVHVSRRSRGARLWASQATAHIIIPQIRS